MIAHLVIWTWKPDVTPERVDALVRALRDLTAGLPSLIRYECGPALGIRQGADFGVLAITEDAEGLESYLDQPAHKDLVATVLTPMAQTRTAIQLDLPPTFLR
jgi:hypothetical protein